MGARIGEEEGEGELKVALAPDPASAETAPSATPHGMVWRAALQRRLSSQPDARIVLVSAPVGYGKSTLLAQWAREDERPVAWLTVQPEHNDPGTFLGDIAVALDGLAPVPDLLGGSSGHGGRDPAMRLAGPGSHLMAQGRPFLLVIDDAHQLTDPTALDAFATVVDHIPAGSQVAVAGGSVARYHFARRRVSHELLELGAEDLAMDEREGAALLRLEGVVVGADTVRDLVERTEGWPAGIALAAIAARRAPDPAAALRGLRGSERVLSEYFWDQLLGRVPSSLVRFLTCTSILERMSGPLCDEVLEDRGTGEHLDALAASGDLFVRPIGAERSWYRYHPLFRDALRYELHEREPDLEVVLHDRASVWFEAHGDIPAAVHHATAAGDAERAGNLIFQQVSGLDAGGCSIAIGPCLQRFPASAIESTPSLALAQAWRSLGAGHSDVVEHWIDVAEQGIARRSSSPLTMFHAQSAMITRALIGVDGVDDMVRRAKAIRVLGPQGSCWSVLACYLEGVGDIFMGHAARGRVLLARAAREACLAPAIRACALAHLAHLRSEAGDWVPARRLVERALREIDQTGPGDNLPLVPVHAMAAAAAARRGDRPQAVEAARRTQTLLGSLGPLMPQTAIFADLVLAEAELLLGDPVAAKALVMEAERLLPQEPRAAGLQAQADRLRKEIESSGFTVGALMLTPAEIRVIEYLPTHLTMAEIAERLYVSRNTVKSQAIAAYRKLGAASRNEAVERARALGVLN